MMKKTNPVHEKTNNKFCFLNLGNFIDANEWINENKEALNQRDCNGKTIVDWILHTYRGKTEYKLKMIDMVFDQVNISAEDLSEICYIFLTEKSLDEELSLSLRKKINTKVNEFDQFLLKEIAQTIAGVFLLFNSNHINKDVMQFFLNLQPDPRFLLEQIQFIFLLNQKDVMITCIKFIDFLQENSEIVLSNYSGGIGIIKILMEKIQHENVNFPIINQNEEIYSVIKKIITTESFKAIKEKTLQKESGCGQLIKI